MCVFSFLLRAVIWLIHKEKSIRPICKSLLFSERPVGFTTIWGESGYYEDLAHFLVMFRARRAAKEAKEAPAQPAPEKVKVEVKKFVKIGRPGYKGGRGV